MNARLTAETSMTRKQRHTPPRASITASDVARRAQVSRATVSFVLNEHGVRNAHVSEETRAKVLQAAQDLGYSMNTAARTLRRGQSEELAILIDLPFSIQKNELFISLQQHALQAGYTPIMYFNEGLTSKQKQELFLKILARRPLGLFATEHSMTRENINLAKQMGVKHLLLHAVRPLPYAPTIVLPTKLAGALAAQHLLARGHRHLGLVQPSDARYDSYGFEQRLEGMRDVISEQAGVTLDILPLQFSQADASRFVETFLSATERPTGLYAFNDEYALLLLGVFADRGIRIPEDVALMGTDDIAFGEIVRPTLTTIRFDAISIGQRVVDMMTILDKGLALPEELTQPLTPELVPRAST
jgi:LacI family transcriptional regulator